MKTLTVLLLTVCALCGPGCSQKTTLNGQGVCAKCQLAETEKCQPAVQITTNGKTETYYVEGRAADELHKFVCKNPKIKVVLTGVVREKDGHNWIRGKLYSPHG
jgi:hypothetical protein